MAYCPECRKETTLKAIDDGIGPNEAHGRREIDVNLVEVTTCCESDKYFADEQDFIDSLRYDLGKELQDRDDLTNLEVLTIEAILRPSLPAVKPNVITHQGTTITSLTQLCENILLAAHQR